MILITIYPVNVDRKPSRVRELISDKKIIAITGILPDTAGQKGGESMQRFTNGLILPISLLLLWFFVSEVQLFSPYLLPSPFTVWNSLGELVRSGLLLSHLLISLRRVFSGFLLAVLIAIPLGICCGRSRFFYNHFLFLLEFLRHVPPLAAIPLIILWAGIGEASKLAIIFLAAFFPLFLNTCSGIHNCDKNLLEVGYSLDFTPGQIVRYIQLPAALESIVTGLQISLGYSWRALIGAELIAASAGIGYLILDAEEMSRPDIVIVGLLCIGIIGSLLDFIFLYLLDLLLPWQKKEARNGTSA